MKCAIMQPTYLPWSGYFNLAASVDVFVFLDDVQFERRSWHSRNRILMNGEECMLTVPVRKVPQKTPLQRIEIAEHGWLRVHRDSLRSAYAKAEHGRVLMDLLEPCYAGPPPTRLVDWNCRVIRVLLDALGIATRTRLASELACGGQRSDHLALICQRLGCDEYLSPRGSMAYLEEDGFAARSGIRLQFQDFDPAPYPQAGARDFVSHLSVVDVIANCGLAFAREYVRCTRTAAAVKLGQLPGQT